MTSIKTVNAVGRASDSLNKLGKAVGHSDIPLLLHLSVINARLLMSTKLVVAESLFEQGEAVYEAVFDKVTSDMLHPPYKDMAIEFHLNDGSISLIQTTPVADYLDLKAVRGLSSEKEASLLKTLFSQPWVAELDKMFNGGDVPGVIVWGYSIDVKGPNTGIHPFGAAFRSCEMIDSADMDSYEGNFVLIPLSQTEEADKGTIETLKHYHQFLTIIWAFMALDCCKTVPAPSVPRSPIKSRNPSQTHAHKTIELDVTALLQDRKPVVYQSLGGTHASPREHERKRHLRRYKSGKEVWIESFTVNKGVGASVTKTINLVDKTEMS